MIPTNAVDTPPQIDPEEIERLTNRLEEATAQVLALRRLGGDLRRSGNPARRAAGEDILRLLEKWS